MVIKKRYLVLFTVIFLTQAPTHAREVYPYIPSNTSFINVDYVQDESNLINFDKMKKKDKMEEAASEVQKASPERLKLDAKEIIYQKAIDYVTRPSSNNIPIL